MLESAIVPIPRVIVWIAGRRLPIPGVVRGDEVELVMALPEGHPVSGLPKLHSQGAAVAESVVRAVA